VTDIEIHTRSGKRVRLDRFAKDVPAGDRNRIRVVLDDWCKTSRWPHAQVVISAWHRDKGWLNYEFD
jgi:hypothetical protein